MASAGSSLALSLPQEHPWGPAGAVGQANHPLLPSHSFHPSLPIPIPFIPFSPFPFLSSFFFPSPHPGGRQSKYAINAFEVFDTETRSWTKFPNIPNKRAFSSFVPTEDKLFSLGGLRQGRLYRQPKFMRTVDVFDIEQGGAVPGGRQTVGVWGWKESRTSHLLSVLGVEPGLQSGRTREGRKGKKTQARGVQQLLGSAAPSLARW